jgi:hypothetical protein
MKKIEIQVSRKHHRLESLATKETSECGLFVLQLRLVERADVVLGIERRRIAIAVDGRRRRRCFRHRVVVDSVAARAFAQQQRQPLLERRRRARHRVHHRRR